MEHWPYPSKDFAVVAAGFSFWGKGMGGGHGPGETRVPLGSSGSLGTDYVD